MADAAKPALSRLDLESLISEARSSFLLLDLALDAVRDSAKTSDVHDDGGITLALTGDQHNALCHAQSLTYRALRDLSERFYDAGEIGR